MGSVREWAEAFLVLVLVLLAVSPFLAMMYILGDWKVTVLAAVLTVGTMYGIPLLAMRQRRMCGGRCGVVDATTIDDAMEETDVVSSGDNEEDNCEDGVVLAEGGWFGGSPEIEIRVAVYRVGDDYKAAWVLRTGEEVSLTAIALALLYLGKAQRTLHELEEGIGAEFRIETEDESDG